MTIWNARSRASGILFRSLWVPDTHVVHIHMHAGKTHIHIKTKQTIEEKKRTRAWALAQGHSIHKAPGVIASTVHALTESELKETSVRRVFGNDV